MKSFLFALLLLGSLFGDEFEHHSHKHIQKELSHIKLTQLQKRELKKILRDFRHKLKEYRKVKKRLQKQKETLFLEEKLSKEQFNHIDTMLCNEAKKIENEFLMQMHTILTPSQRKRFIEHFDDWEVE